MKRCEAVIASSVTMLSSWAAMWREHVRTGFTWPGQTGHTGWTSSGTPFYLLAFHCSGYNRLHCKPYKFQHWHFTCWSIGTIGIWELHQQHLSPVDTAHAESMPLLCTVKCSQANWSVATIKIESYHIAIGTMDYQAWGIIKATDLAEHNRTWNTMYKYISNGTGQEGTSVCGGEGDESCEWNYFYSWMLIFQAGLEAQRHL